MNESKKINRQQMTNAIARNIEGREEFAKKYPPKGYAKTGNDTCVNRAYRLLGYLQGGGTPSTQQVVGYFGKGARFEEDEA